MVQLIKREDNLRNPVNAVNHVHVRTKCFMVLNVSQLLTKTKTFKLNQSLTCADFGIYVATCVICHVQYVGQTSNKCFKRWSAHRSNWNTQYCKTDSDKDQKALSRHYSENHGTINKHLCTKHTPLLLSNNQVVILWISVKINGIT